MFKMEDTREKIISELKKKGRTVPVKEEEIAEAIRKINKKILSDRGIVIH